MRPLGAGFCAWDAHLRTHRRGSLIMTASSLVGPGDHFKPFASGPILQVV